MTRPPGDPAPQPPKPERPAPPKITVSSEELFEGRHEVIIVHGGRQYILRKTRRGNLILTK